MKVLVVDDESFVTESMERFIKRLGHTPLTAGNGASAIRQYKENNPEMVLLDVNLPDIKGDVVFREIVKFDKNAVVYFFTGYPNEYLKMQGIEIDTLKAAGCFHKPVMLDTIKLIIEQRQKINEGTKPS